MPTEVASTEYGVIIHYDDWNTLELKWLPAPSTAVESTLSDQRARENAHTLAVRSGGLT